MASVVGNGRRAVIDPLALSRPLGAGLVFLGLDRCMPLLHGSQGCSAFAKAFLTKHFREPIPMQTTAVTELTAVLGSTANLVSALDSVRGRLSPDVIGVITTGVSEVSGEDVEAALRAYRSRLRPQDPLIVLVAAPDFVGGLSDGWSGGLTALVDAALADAASADDAVAEPRPPQQAGSTFAVLTGVSLTTADLDEISLLVDSFGLAPLLVPDLSGSMDGHLGAAWSPLTAGGTTRAQLARLATAEQVQAIGVTAAPAAARLGAGIAARTGTPGDVRAADHLSGLDAVDAFVERLWHLAGGDVPARVRRGPSRLTDALLDTHFVLDGARVALALEPELLVATTALLAATGAQVVTAIAPADVPVLRQAACAEVVVGDLSDLRERAAQAGAEVVIGSSHATATAEAIGATHLPLGIPVDHRFGGALGGVAGYRGGLRFVTELANAVLAHRDHPHPPVIMQTRADHANLVDHAKSLT